MRSRNRWMLVALLVLLAARPCAASLVTIDFDDLAAISNNSQPGNTYAGLGVSFTTLNSVPNTVDAFGDTFVPSVLDDTFWLISNSDSVSPPNFAAATNGGLNDLLIAFTTPITSLQLQTDDSPESPQEVRLLALRNIGTGFEVVGVASGLDNAVSAPGNVLQVDFGGVPFNFALFQTTTEQEGIDNLTFDEVDGTAVPEPATLILLGAGLLIGSALPAVRGSRRSARSGRSGPGRGLVTRAAILEASDRVARIHRTPPADHA